MKYYDVFIDTPTRVDKAEHIYFISQGFNIWAAFCGFFWAFYHKMWNIGVIMLSVELLITLAEQKGWVAPSVAILTSLAVFFVMGFEANYWRSYHLLTKGKLLIATTAARNLAEARQRFLDCHLHHA